MWILAAFVAVPLIEIGLFIQVGGLIGLWPTLGLVLLTALAGTALVRTEGARALADLRGALSEMRDPTAPLAHGAMILLAGALLLTPGFFTDTVGILLLIPQVRARVLRAVAARVQVARFQMGPGRPDRPEVIDGEFYEVEPENRPVRGPSGWTRH